MITCRTAHPQELDLVLDWAAEEGWNPGVDDASAFFAADPEGFFVAVDADDTPLAAISVVNHSAAFAFLGLYLVRPAHRGRGIGLQLWQHALRHAGQRTVGLDGVEAQQQNYIASGFAHAGGTTRLSGRIHGLTDPDIRAAGPDDIPDLVAREAAASGVAKPAYLSAWFGNTANRTTLVSESTQGIDGLCTVRTCSAGVKIGPLIAESDGTAERLIGHAATLTEDTVTLDVPETARTLGGLCQSLGLTPGFKTARMYRGPFSARPHRIFAVTSLELG